MEGKESNHSALEKARAALNDYLSAGGRRHTPERDAVLEAVFDLPGLFRVEDVESLLEKRSYVVCRATIYNALRLFLRLQLVESVRKPGQTYYKVVTGKGTCQMVCTMCGKTREVSLRGIEAAMADARLPRFRMKSYRLTVYGLCSACQGKLTRQSKLQKKSYKDNQ